MKIPFIGVLLIFLGLGTRAQELTLLAANDFLPAFQKDDSLLMRALQIKHNSDPTLLAGIAGITSCPRIFTFLATKFMGVDTELPIDMALASGNERILKAALKLGLSLGEYPVNALLNPVWKTVDVDGIDPKLVVELLLSMSLPDGAMAGYRQLLPSPIADKERSKVGIWLISSGQEFDFLELPKLQMLPLDYKDIGAALSKQLLDMPEGQEIRGFANKKQAMLLAAVLTNDLTTIERIAEDLESLEILIGEQSLLDFAVGKADLTVIKFLLANGANADWHNAQSGESILLTALTRQDKAVLTELMLHQKSAALKDAGGFPVLLCVKNFFKCSATSDQMEIREFYLYALKELYKAGADFDLHNGRWETAIELLPKQAVDSLSRSVALLVLESTKDQLNLSSYSSGFSYVDENDMLILSLLCKKLVDPSSLFYNDDLEKAALFPHILQHSVNLPDTRVFSSLMRSACYERDVQKVRFFLNDVPLLYLKRNTSFNPDSLRRRLVNEAVTGENENTLYSFLKQTHIPDWSTRAIIKALMAAGADMYQMQRRDKKRPIDLFMSSDSYRKHYSNEIISGLLSNIVLDLDPPDAWEKVPVTGDLYRKSILSYQRDRDWLDNVKNCLELDFAGATAVGNNRRVRVEQIGIIELGKFPVVTCGPVDLAKVIGNQGNYAFMIDADTTKHNYREYPLVQGYRYGNAVGTSFKISGSTGIVNLKFKIKSKIDIPATPMNENEHFLPPMMVIHNHGDPLLLNQNGIVTTIAKNAQVVLDRSKGNISIEYELNGNTADLWLDLFGRIEDTIYPDLQIPDNNDIQSRLKLYNEVVRLQSRIWDNRNITDEDKIFRRQDVVTLHLLSEYALQRNFPKKVKEEQALNISQLNDLDRLLGPLGEFYAKHAVLDFSSAQVLRETLDNLLESAVLTKEVQAKYSQLSQELNKAGQLSELAETYSQLMNTELFQQAERQLDHKARLTRELSLYTTSGHLKLD